MARDYYDILGVSRSATADDIKKAYRKLAHEHHPDKGGGDETKFKEVNAAYQVLGNSDKRQKYDQFGSAYQNTAGGQGAQGFNWQDFAQTQGFGSQNIEFDLGDLFGDFFGFGGGSRKRKGSAKREGADIEAELQISFVDVVFGASRTLDLTHEVVCSQCKGSGAQSGTKIKECRTCNGRGEVDQVQQSIFGQFATRVTCPSCKGEGKEIETPCKACRGSGRHEEHHAIKVQIPAGINEGQRIRLSGQGEAGIRGGSPGDLFLTFRILPDRRFRREGDDIFSAHQISIADAVLGTAIHVETVDGLVKLKVPAGTESGKVFLLSGKGVPHLRSRGRGDHKVTVEIHIPKKLTKSEKHLFEQLQSFEANS